MKSFDIDSKNNIDSFIYSSNNNIIILKKIKSLRQLRRTEKELVHLCYKEAIIRGFTLKEIQQYIASKTKIWIEWSCLEYLKKTEEQENREWYMRLAKDHFAYIGIYRNAIDQLHQLTHELWKIVMDNKAEPSDKTYAMKEIHNIEKTKVLLLRDLPFITRLSNFYDLKLLNNSLSNNSNSYSIDNKPKPIPDFQEKDHNEIYKDLKNRFKDEEIKDTIATLTGNELELDNNKSSKYQNIDDPVLEEMQRQSQI